MVVHLSRWQFDADHYRFKINIHMFMRVISFNIIEIVQQTLQDIENFIIVVITVC